jgi:hypothetical protein
MALLGEVTTDKQAFDQIIARLKGDVGTIIKLISLGKKNGFFKDTAPFWALARMTFPIAEALGDLIYRDKSTVTNLTSVLANEFEAERKGYRGKAACIALLYRHSLTHTDELRKIVNGPTEIEWRISYRENAKHLELIKKSAGIYRLNFDTTAFYTDILRVCKSAKRKSWGGGIMSQYNSWLTVSLAKPTTHLKKNEKEALKEIAAF